MAGPSTILKLGRKLVTSIDQANPQLKTRAMDFVSKATNTDLRSNLQGLERLASKDKTGYAVVALNAARAGIDPDDFLTDDLIQELQDVEMTNLKAAVKAEFNRSFSLIDQSSLLKKMDEDMHAQNHLRIRAVSLIAKRMGLVSPNAIQEFHVFLKMFLEMDEESVTHTLAYGFKG